MTFLKLHSLVALFSLQVKLPERKFITDFVNTQDFLLLMTLANLPKEQEPIIALRDERFALLLFMISSQHCLNHQHQYLNLFLANSQRHLLSGHFHVWAEFF